jgi:hypothetical protein
MNQTDRHSQLSPNGELANIARFGCQSVFAQDTGCRPSFFGKARPEADVRYRVNASWGTEKESDER